MNMEYKIKPIVYRRCEEIMQELSDRGFDSGDVPRGVVEEAIIAAVGASRSTVIQYFKALCVHKFLDLVAPGVYRILGAELELSPAEIAKDKPFSSDADIEAQLEAMRQAERDTQAEAQTEAQAETETEQGG